MGPYIFFCFLMDFIRFLSVLIAPYLCLWILMVLRGPYGSLCVHMDSNGTLSVLISHYASLSVAIGFYRSLHVFMGLYTFFCVLIVPCGS